MNTANARAAAWAQVRSSPQVQRLWRRASKCTRCYGRGTYVLHRLVQLPEGRVLWPLTLRCGCQVLPDRQETQVRTAVATRQKPGTGKHGARGRTRPGKLSRPLPVKQRRPRKYRYTDALEQVLREKPGSMPWSIR